MKTGRLEAFSDGVLAIIITIMVLGMDVPKGASFSSLLTVAPKFMSYVLSFIYVGIYWNNHHHLFQAIEKVNGKILWANLALLFTLSLIPLTTAWMGENNFDQAPVALYGINLILCAVVFVVLEKIAVKHEGKDSNIGKALKSSNKENITFVIYITGVLLAFFLPKIGAVCYAIVAIIWLIPDQRIERQLQTINKD